MKKMLITVIIVLLITSSGCSVSQEKVLNVALENYENNEMTELTSNFSKLEEETVEKFVNEIDSMVNRALVQKDYDRANVLIDKLRNIDQISEYVINKQDVIDRVEKSSIIYEEANKLYNEISQLKIIEIDEINDYIFKNNKIQECVTKYLLIDSDLKIYFFEIDDKIEKLKKYISDLYNKYLILTTEDHIEKNEFRYAVWNMKTAAQNSEGEEKNQFNALKAEYFNQWEEFIDSNITEESISEAGINRYYSKNTNKEIGDFSFYVYSEKSKESDWYSFNLTTGIRLNEFMQYNKIEIGSDDKKYTICINDEVEQNEKSDNKYTYEWTVVKGYYKILKKLMVEEKINVRFLSDTDYIDYTVSSSQMDNLRQMIEFYEFKNNLGIIKELRKE